MEKSQWIDVTSMLKNKLNHSKIDNVNQERYAKVKTSDILFKAAFVRDSFWCVLKL